MALLKELKVQPIIILAKNFNPSVFNQFWLINNGYIGEKEVLPNSIFTPQFAQIFTTKFNLLILPEQLQFNSIDLTKSEENLYSCLIPMIKRLSETPYIAIGINFFWLMNDDGGKTISELSKELFYRNDSNIYSRFKGGDANFGIYLSKDIEGVRLKLDIKPITAPDIMSGDRKEYIQCSFNYHLDLNNKTCYQDLQTCLQKWNIFRKDSEDLINLF
jgi:hypothetical protein